MRNFVQDGEVLTVTAPYALTSGQGAQIGTTIFGIATTDAANGAPVELMVGYGVADVTALGTDTAAVGAPLYWDNANRRLTTTVGSNLKVGVAVAAKANGDTTARVRLNGVF